MPFISVLIPVYNGIQFLEECVDSILAQTYTDFDIHIGVNGHASDGGTVYAIAQMIAEKDARIHAHVLNSSVKNKADAIHELLAVTQSKWIALIDCDDMWLPEKLEHQIKSIMNADVIGTGAKYFGEFSGSPKIPYGHFPGTVCAHVNPFINSSVLIKRELLKYPEYIEGLEDYYLWMNLALKNVRFYNVDQQLTMHRVHAASAFNSNKKINVAPLLEWFKYMNAQNGIMV